MKRIYKTGLTYWNDNAIKREQTQGTTCIKNTKSDLLSFNSTTDHQPEKGHVLNITKFAFASFKRRVKKRIKYLTSNKVHILQTYVWAISEKKKVSPEIAK